MNTKLINKVEAKSEARKHRELKEKEDQAIKNDRFKFLRPLHERKQKMLMDTRHCFEPERRKLAYWLVASGSVVNPQRRSDDRLFGFLSMASDRSN